MFISRDYSCFVSFDQLFPQVYPPVVISAVLSPKGFLLGVLSARSHAWLSTPGSTHTAFSGSVVLQSYSGVVSYYRFNRLGPFGLFISAISLRSVLSSTFFTVDTFVTGLTDEFSPLGYLCSKKLVYIWFVLHARVLYHFSTLSSLSSIVSAGCCQMLLFDARFALYSPIGSFV